MAEEKITLDDLEKSLAFCSEDLQKTIFSSNVDSDVQYLLDHIAQQQHYVLSDIIKYLKQQ